MLISFLFGIIVLIVVIYVVQLIIGMLNLPAPIKTIAYLIVGLVALYWILSLFGLATPASFGNLNWK